MDTIKKRRSPVSTRLIDDLERRIRSGEFAANTMLPSIRMLAGDYSASPRTVESALHKMCERSLLQRVPNRGFKVLEHEAIGNAKIAIIYQAHGSSDPRPEIGTAICDRLDYYGYSYDAFDVLMRSVDPAYLKENYAAVIFARQFYRADISRQLSELGVRQVIAGLETPSDLPASFVDRAALIDSTLHMLYDMGHRNIALVARSTDKYFYPRMIRQYHQSMEELGLDHSDATIAVMERDFELGAYLCGRELLTRPRRPSVIIISRDYQACGVHQACLEAGLTVGKDISLIGYDDIGWPAGHEFLTTYIEPCRELGFTAVEILRSILNGDHAQLQREVKPALKMRKSLVPLL